MSDSQIQPGGPALPPNTNNPFTDVDLAAGEPVYMHVNSGVNSLLAALATTALSSAAVGLAARSATAGERALVQLSQLLTLTTEEWDARVTGQTGGLVTGTYYYVSDIVAGKLKATAPTGGSGHWIAPIGLAWSPTTMQVLPQLPVQSSS